MRLEICAVDKVNWHQNPDDKKFNSVDVVMRDRAHKNSKDNRHIRKQLPVLQNNFLGHHLGWNWNPRKGDLIYVFFYGDRKGIVLGTAHSWAEYPVCMPTPYDIPLKGGQWRAPYQDPWKDFPKQPYPQAKKPYCFRWWHGQKAFQKGDIDEGRDWCFLFDYCREGDACPDCRICGTIDSIGHILNHYFKFYSEQTESRKAYPLRGVYHNPSGSYWLFEGSNKPSDEYVSEFYTEGLGFWTIQGSIIQDGTEYYKGHVRHNPKGSIDIHSASEWKALADESTGARVAVIAPDDDQLDFAVQLKDFATGAFVQILKSGKIEGYSPSEILWKAGQKITLEAPIVEETNDNIVANHNQVGSCSHGPCSCGGGGGGGGSNSGWPSQNGAGW